MNISEIVSQVVQEEIQNKRLFNTLLTNWGAEKPEQFQTIEQWENEVESIYNRFREIQNGLSPNKPQVVAFLYRFNGEHAPEFDQQHLKDITKYSYTQIKSLLSEYEPDLPPEDDEDEIISSKTKPTPQKIEASKKLWYGSKNRVINEEQFRAYFIKDQLTSIKYGYYVEHTLAKISKNLPWCVTWRPDQNRTNLWQNYRSRHKRTFYYVIDDSRPTTDKYHMSALQVDPSTRQGYRLTSMLNDGDNQHVWEDIVRIYPQLANHRADLESKEFSEDEIKEKSVVSRITETPGSPYEFRRMERKYKRAFIAAQISLHQPASWESMDEGLRALYIHVTTNQDATDRFNNWLLLTKIKEVPNEFKALDNKLKSVGLDGVSHIIDSLFKREYRVARTSISNQNIKLFESVVNRGKFGIYNGEHVAWHKFNGVEYTPQYSEGDPVAFTHNNTNYIVETYSITPEPDNKSFYCIYAISYDDDISTDAYFLSQAAWSRLMERFPPKENEDDIVQITDFDPERDSDIKESIKRKIRSLTK